MGILGIRVRLVEFLYRFWYWGFFVLLSVTIVVSLARAVDSTTPTAGSLRTIQGTILKETAEGTQPIRDGVILIYGVTLRAPKQRNQPAFLDQIHTTFQPHILPVQVGQPIKFLNSDSQIHNVRLNKQDDDTQLMNELTPPGDSMTYTPKRPGIIHVRCDIHPSMEAFLVIRSELFLDTMIHSDGHFRLEVPGPFKGKHKIQVWSEKEGLITGSHTFTGDTSASLSLILDPEG